MLYKEKKVILHLQIAKSGMGDFCLGWALFLALLRKKSNKVEFQNTWRALLKGSSPAPLCSPQDSATFRYYCSMYPQPFLVGLVSTLEAGTDGCAAASCLSGRRWPCWGRNDWQWYGARPDTFTFHEFNEQALLPSIVPGNSKLAPFFGIAISHRNLLHVSFLLILWNNWRTDIITCQFHLFSKREKMNELYGVKWGFRPIKGNCTKGFLEFKSWLQKKLLICLQIQVLCLVLRCVIF